MFYRAYGRLIESSRPLPELPDGSGSDAGVQLSWDATIQAPPGLRWTTLWRFPGGEPWVTAARAPGAHHFRFGRSADFRVTSSQIAISPRGRVATDYLRHLLLDQALPLALASDGALVLHASAVLIDGRAVLFAGRAGAGKSTMAALLAKDGAPVLADDGVLLEERHGEVHAVPSYPGLRLFPDSSTALQFQDANADRTGFAGKRRVVQGTSPALAAVAASPAGRIYVLSAGPRLTIERVSRRDTAVELVRHAYRADTEDPVRLRQQLDRIAQYSGALDAWALTCPRDFSTSVDVARAVAAHAVLR
jgi:hypothetical protein